MGGTKVTTDGFVVVVTANSKVTVGLRTNRKDRLRVDVAWNDHDDYVGF